MDNSDGGQLSKNETPPVSPEQQPNRKGNPSQEVSPSRVDVPGSPQSPPSPPAEERARAERAEYRDDVRLNIEFLAVLVGIVGLVGLYYTFRETQEATRAAIEAAVAAKEQVIVMRQQFAATERPWVSVEVEIPYPMVFDRKGNLGIDINLTVKNVGRVVAQEAWIWSELTFLDPDGEDITAWKRRKEVCDAYRSPEGPSQNIASFALFPGGEPRQFIRKTGKWAKEIAPELARALPANKGKVGFAIIGCVSYRSASEDPSHWRHQTRFLYHLGLWDDETQTSTLFMRPSGGPYDITLTPQTSGESAD